jgi:glycosyltransferase involved in cell wall biosynthesis
MSRIAIVTTHPIQYNAPLFAKLASMPGLQTMVFYTWSQSEQGGQFDPDFNRTIKWDIPLLEGYPFRFIMNRSKRPGSDHFFGIDNPTLIREITAWKPDALIIYGWAFRSHLACLRHFSGKIPIFFRGDSTLLDEQPGVKKFLRRNFLTWVYRHIDFALCVGQNNRAYYLAHGLRPEQLIKAPHAIDNARFSSDETIRTASANERRRALGIADDQQVLLFVGKLEAKKDPGFVIRLASVLQDPCFHFVFVGNGHLEQELRDAATGDRRIHFLGFQNQQAMPEIYRMADVLILPSRWNETWGLAVNESMACGRPVIVSDHVGCAPDLVDHGKTGWIFSLENEDESDVAGWIRTASTDPGILKKMGHQATLKIGDYSIDRLAAGICQALEKINRKEK